MWSFKDYFMASVQASVCCLYMCGGCMCMVPMCVLHACVCTLWLLLPVQLLSKCIHGMNGIAFVFVQQGENRRRHKPLSPTRHKEEGGRGVVGLAGYSQLYIMYGTCKHSSHYVCGINTLCHIWQTALVGHCTTRRYPVSGEKWTRVG